MALVQKVFAYIGVGVVSYLFSKLLIMLFQVFVAKGKSVDGFGAKEGFWAVVTGSTNGIGREMALELAKRGFNVALISRSPAKLIEVQKEIEAIGRNVRTIAVDFSAATSEDWAKIGQLVDSMQVGVLVNNVGLSHECPTALVDESLERCEAIVAVNVTTMVRLTKLVLPQMQKRRRGLVINNGSFSALVPSPLLSVYAGSKAFVKSFSQAVGGEMAPHGVTVEYLNTYFVVSAMSKIRRASFAIPTAKAYTQAVLGKIGLPCGTFEPHCSVPYPAHALICFAIERFASLQLVLKSNYKTMAAMRERALKKRKAH